MALGINKIPIYPIFNLLKGTITLDPKPYTLNSSFHFLFHYPHKTTRFHLLKGNYRSLLRPVFYKKVLEDGYRYLGMYRV